MNTSDENTPSKGDGKAGVKDNTKDEPSKEDERFNDQLMQALEDSFEELDTSKESKESKPSKGLRQAETEGVDAAAKTPTSPGVEAPASEEPGESPQDGLSLEAEDGDGPDPIPPESISAESLRSFDEYDDDPSERWSSPPPGSSDQPPTSEPPSLRSLALHLPAPAPLPKPIPTSGEDVLNTTSDDPLNMLSESLRPPPVMKAAPRLIRDDDEETDDSEARKGRDDDGAAVPLRRQRPSLTARERKERGDWVKRSPGGRRREDQRPLLWPCVAFFCLGVVATLVVQRLMGVGVSSPVTTSPDRPSGQAATGPDGRGQPPPASSPLAHEPISSSAPGAAQPDDSLPTTHPESSSQSWASSTTKSPTTGDGTTEGAPSPSASAVEPTASATETASAEPPPGEAPPFDTSAAAAVLGAAAANAASCADGEHKGSARVAVTFAPSGRSTVAIVESGSLLGTSVASCIASVMGRAQVPAFSGGPTTVRKKVRVR